MNLAYKPILVVGHLGIELMLFCHIPFVFYIGKEHILQAVDEHLNFSLSLMVDRIKNRFKGDPRHFLVQKKFVAHQSIASQILSQENDAVNQLID